MAYWWFPIKTEESYEKTLVENIIFPMKHGHLVGGFKDFDYFPFHIWDNLSHRRTHNFQDG